MNHFPDKLLYEDVTAQGDGTLALRLYRSFRYNVGGEKSGIVVTVPAGFVTDLASVPRFFWRIVPPFGKYTPAAVVHDFLYSSQNLSRAMADAVFLEAMGVLGVPKWKRVSMYLAVRCFGWGPWRRATLTVDDGKSIT